MLLALNIYYSFNFPKNKVVVTYFTCLVSFAKRYSHANYVKTYMIASTQKSIESVAFIAVLVFELLSGKFLFIIIKDNRNC